MSTKGLLSEQPQGIGSILGGSEFEKPNKTAASAAGAATSLRRTLSADMSSKKWLLQHGFSPLKRIASSEELQSEPSSDDIWNSNQSKEEEEKKKNNNNKINEQQKYDMWSSILTEKPSSLPPPYVHPLVKRSKASLTGKSLEICTENLGSDSGSDGFSSSEISSSSSDDDDEQEQEVVEVEEEEEEEVKESQTVEMAGNVHEKVNYSTTCSVSSVSKKSSPPRSFPPPLPSLSRPGLHIRPRREDGRLVLQAITVPTQNYFHAQRQDGRLLLTFIKSPSQQQSMENDENEIDEEEIVEKVLSDDDEEEEVVFESEDEEEEAMVERGGFEMEMEMELSQPPPIKKLPTGVINVHRSAVMVNKIIGGLAINRNPNWSHKLEKMVQMKVEEEEEEANDSTLFPQSLPSPPPRKAMPRLIPTSPTTITSSFNTYEYCWRRKPSSVTGGGIMTKQSLPIINNNNNNITNNNNNNNTINKTFLVSSRNSSKAYQEKQQQFVVKRGRGEKGDYLLAPLIKSCKEPRRSLLSWEPYCIATS